MFLSSQTIDVQLARELGQQCNLKVALCYFLRLLSVSFIKHPESKKLRSVIHQLHENKQYIQQGIKQNSSEEFMEFITESLPQYLEDKSHRNL